MLRVAPLVLLLLAGCAATPERKMRNYVVPEVPVEEYRHFQYPAYQVQHQFEQASATKRKR